MFEGIAGAIGKALGSSLFAMLGDKILQPILAAWAKSRDVDLERFKAATEADKAQALALIGYEARRTDVQGNLLLAAMAHPLWWIAWALFVLPVGVYHAAIYIVSTLDAPLIIKQVPKTQEEWGLLIVMSIFGIHGATGIVAAIVDRIGAKR